MKATGFVKKIDEMGRVVIPKDIRQAINVDHGDVLQFFVEDDSIIMKKFSDACVFCGSDESLTELNGKHVCAECIAKLK